MTSRDLGSIGLFLLVILTCLSGCTNWGGWDFSRPEDRIAASICGPEGYNDWNDNGPVCEREGWNGHRYVRRK